MKVFVIASTEYRANCPDMFLMDEQGNYYGAERSVYARHANYPKDINYWRNAEGSDSGRYFNIDEVELTQEQIDKYCEALKAYYDKYDNCPTFGESYPEQKNFKTKKAYKEAVDSYMAREAAWCKESNIAQHIRDTRALWFESIRIFCSFSAKVYEAIKDNDPVRYC